MASTKLSAILSRGRWVNLGQGITGKEWIDSIRYLCQSLLIMQIQILQNFNFPSWTNTVLIIRRPDTSIEFNNLSVLKKICSTDYN